MKNQSNSQKVNSKNKEKSYKDKRTNSCESKLRYNNHKLNWNSKKDEE